MAAPNIGGNEPWRIEPDDPKVTRHASTGENIIIVRLLNVSVKSQKIAATP